MTTFAGHLLTGDHASRPAATAVPAGTLYSCDDHSLVYQSDGAAWSTWATLGGGGGVVVAGDVDSEAATDGQVLTADGGGAAAWETPAGGGGATEVAYAQITAQVTATTEVTVVTAPAFTADGTSAYMIEFFASRVSTDVGTNLYIHLKEGGSYLGYLGRVRNEGGSGGIDGYRPHHGMRRLVPSAGSHTYAVSAHNVGGGSGIIMAEAGGSGLHVPAFIRITKW